MITQPFIIIFVNYIWRLPTKMDISFLQSLGGFELTFGARKREDV